MWVVPLLALSVLVASRAQAATKIDTLQVSIRIISVCQISNPNLSNGERTEGEIVHIVCDGDTPFRVDKREPALKSHHDIDADVTNTAPSLEITF